MQDTTVIAAFGASAIAISYAANFLSARQASIRNKRLIGALGNILVAAMLLACGYVLSGGYDDSIWFVAVILGIFLIVKFKRTKFCPACGTRSAIKFGVPNEICRNCGTLLR